MNLTTNNHLQSQIDRLNIKSRAELKSPAIQQHLTELLRAQGLDAKKVHWHKQADNSYKAELCLGHVHQKPEHDHKPKQASALHQPVEACYGPGCSVEKKTSIIEKFFSLFQAA